MRDTGKNSGPLVWTGNTVLIVSGLLASLFLAWQILAGANFFYPLLHDVAGIQETIAEYAPLNIYKASFDETTREQRVELFRQIVYGINHDGKGLEAIQYFNASGELLGQLLRPPEIIHLRDVANLLNVLRKAALVAGAVFVVMVIVYRWKRRTIPSPGRIMAVTVLTALALGLLIGLSGATEVFYQWHTLVFPDGHQWFFYYEESLMTMLMKAPDIFAWIAVMLLVLALVIFYLLLVLTRMLLVE